ncbi:hypothetical protein [Romboutsia ilealis]|uniref:hypothetical protein n=1 Tax=Romboutsia ilealis TaxID=1115758 RepID=UPI00272AE804|nr:hypothetical protein [Romboutsia ilealis]
MVKYKIYLRREKAEISISITEIPTDKIVYKNGFFSSVDYHKYEEFKELKSKFLQYVGESIIQFRNVDRCHELFHNLMSGKIMTIDKYEIDETLNLVNVIGGVK